SEQSIPYNFEILLHVAHEIRTSLYSIIGFAQYLLEVSTIPQHLEILEIIERSGKSLLFLSQNLLDAAQQSSGKLHLLQEDFDMYEMVYELSSIIAVHAHTKGVRFSIFIHHN